MNEMKWCIEYLEKYNRVQMNYFSSLDNLRALMNITMPYSLCDEYYVNQDKVLTDILSHKKIITINDISFKNKIGVYKGDITLLKVDAIVNACNEQLLGCFSPLHSCIDNAIHSYAGLQVRRDLMKVMATQGHDEENGKCKVTKAYNLPSNYIFHTVGPKVYLMVSEENKKDLENCYLSCLVKAEEMNLKSIAFPCISTGVYSYPKKDAALLAYTTVKKYIESHKDTCIDYIIFNVFTEEDDDTYKRLIK